MLVTFDNRFEIVENYEGTRRVQYKHRVPCNMKVFIEKLKPQTDKSKPPPERDWEIVMEGSEDESSKETKVKLVNELTTYIKQRTRKQATALPYKEIEKLATVKSVA